jgi:CRP-like cAMP-binding protein
VDKLEPLKLKECEVALSSPEQQTRVLAHGRLRQAKSGETIVEPSTPEINFFVVVSGRLELHEV